MNKGWVSVQVTVGICSTILTLIVIEPLDDWKSRMYITDGCLQEAIMEICSAAIYSHSSYPSRQTGHLYLEIITR